MKPIMSKLRYTCGRCGASGDTLVWFAYHKAVECQGRGT
jgi:hypothetical protein